MLYIVPTPIGNLRDITLRAIDVLTSVNAIICEDTRHTKKLLDHYSIEQPLLSYHEHSKPEKLHMITSELEKGKILALVSDGGTPLISDPGFKIVQEAIRLNITVEALPGPTALTTALAGSGLAVDSFSFFGFLPPKSAPRMKELARYAEREETLIFYESPFRLVKCLENMLEVLGDREAVVARELTKKFEEYARGTLSDLIEKFSSKKVLGEIVILVSGNNRKKVLI